MNKQWVLREEAKELTSQFCFWEQDINGHKILLEEVGSKLNGLIEAEDRLIFLYQIHKSLETDLSNHKCTFEDPTLCITNQFYWKSIFYIEQEIRKLNSGFDFKIFRPMIISDVVKENIVGLSKYPNVGREYQKAIDKLNEEKFERNLLDDLRLSFELLLREILQNNKSLENQIGELGVFLKEQESSKECRNMVTSLIKYFCDYQNAYIKHDNQVTRSEVDLMTNLTSTFIAYILHLDKNSG